MVELLVILPVLLVLLLAAADMGKLFVISGKSEIAARYSAMRHFRGPPFGDAYPVHSNGEEIERIFFDDALDDNRLAGGEGSEDDDPDVMYVELQDEDLLYAPVDLGHPFLVQLWDYVNLAEDLLPIRGTRCTFAYDLPFFPYGREHPMEETLPLQAQPAEGGLAAGYDASGYFVVLTEPFSGEHGAELRLHMETVGFLVGLSLGSEALLALGAVLWLIFLP